MLFFNILVIHQSLLSNVTHSKFRNVERVRHFAQVCLQVRLRTLGIDSIFWLGVKHPSHSTTSCPPPSALRETGLCVISAHVAHVFL